MQSVLMHPGGVIAGAHAVPHFPDAPSRIGDVITASQRLSAEARLAVYSQAYFARLLDCLRLEFPAVRHAAGNEAFDGFAAGYLQSEPSTSYTLAELGRRFSPFLEQTRPEKSSAAEAPDFADFLIDLARLERSYSEVFDLPGPEREPGLSRDDILSIPIERFARSRLLFHDTVRLLTLRFPCQDYASAVRRGQDAVPPPPATTHLVVFRRAYVVRRLALTPLQHELLAALQRGAVIEVAIQTAVAGADPADVSAEEIRQSFLDWTEAEFFRGLAEPDDGEPA